MTYVLTYFLTYWLADYLVTLFSRSYISGRITDLKLKLCRYCRYSTAGSPEGAAVSSRSCADAAEDPGDEGTLLI